MEDIRDWTTIPIFFLKILNIMSVPILFWCTFQAEWASSFRTWIWPTEETEFQLHKKTCALFSRSHCHRACNVWACKTQLSRRNIRVWNLILVCANECQTLSRGGYIFAISRILGSIFQASEQLGFSNEVFYVMPLNNYTL